MTRLSQHVLLWTLIVHFLTFVERENVKSTFCFNINGWVVLVYLAQVSVFRHRGQDHDQQRNEESEDQQERVVTSAVF